MEMVTTRVSGTGSALPPTRLTNDDLARRLSSVDTVVTSEWIEKKTGVRERRIARTGVSEDRNSHLAALASRRALQAAGRTAEEVDQIIVATISPDTLTPSTSARVQHLLGARAASVMDVNAACTGFISALRVAHQSIRCGDSSCVLVVGSEVLSAFTDWTELRSCILFGDGAGAVVVERADEDASGRISDFQLGADGARAEIFSIPAGGSWLPPSTTSRNAARFTMMMDGPAVRSAAEEYLVHLLRPLLATEENLPGEPSWIIPHQANLRIIERVVEVLGISPHRVLSNIAEYGNTSAASIPILLDEAWRAGRFIGGSAAHLVAIGAGFTFGRVTLHF